MKEIFIFILIGYGTSNILIYSSLFEGWRNILHKLGNGPLSLHKLFTCMMCLPTWVGFLLSFIMFQFGAHELSPSGNLEIDLYWLQILLDGIFLSGCVWLIHTIQEYFEKED